MFGASSARNSVLTEHAVPIVRTPIDDTLASDQTQYAGIGHCLRAEVVSAKTKAAHIRRHSLAACDGRYACRRVLYVYLPSHAAKE